MMRRQPKTRRGRTQGRQTARSASSFTDSLDVVEYPDLTPSDIVQPAASSNTRLSELKSASSADTQPSKRRRRHSTTPPSSEQDTGSYSSPIIVDTSDDNKPLNHNTIVLGAREKIAAAIKALVAKLEEKPDIESKRSISDLLESASCECRRYKRMAQGFKSE
ncbi:hypothetical protein DL98DRAFT_522455 [Cadophora sp. DSE1049]|nr:hypothetical protein DL98DRAFT_522455 [Cadophora sp. DSE1049]